MDDRVTPEAVEAGIRAAYDSQPSWWHEPDPNRKRVPKTYEQCYGCSPLDREEDVVEMRVTLEAALPHLSPWATGEES